MYLSPDDERALLGPLLPQLAEHLGPDWQYVYDPAERSRWGELVATAYGGLSIAVSLDTSGQTPRLAVRPNLPTIERDPYSPDFDKVRGIKASLSLDRPAARLAAEIRRRVVDPYALVLPEILERQNTELSRRAGATGTAEQIAKLLGSAGITPREREILDSSNGGITLYGPRGLHVEVGRGYYSFKFGATEAARAVAITRALMGLLSDAD